MDIELNGEVKSIPDGTTVADLLSGEGIDRDTKGTAVAVNAEVVPRSEWHAAVLRPDDRVDVIRAVQGG
jgi:sulfur carrier protein